MSLASTQNEESSKQATFDIEEREEAIAALAEEIILLEEARTATEAAAQAFADEASELANTVSHREEVLQWVWSSLKSAAAAVAGANSGASGTSHNTRASVKRSIGDKLGLQHLAMEGECPIWEAPAVFLSTMSTGKPELSSTKALDMGSAMGFHRGWHVDSPYQQGIGGLSAQHHQQQSEQPIQYRLSECNSHRLSEGGAQRVAEALATAGRSRSRRETMSGGGDMGGATYNKGAGTGGVGMFSLSLPSKSCWVSPSGTRLNTRSLGGVSTGGASAAAVNSGSRDVLQHFTTAADRLKHQQQHQQQQSQNAQHHEQGCEPGQEPLVVAAAAGLCKELQDMWGHVEELEEHLLAKAGVEAEAAAARQSAAELRQQVGQLDSRCVELEEAVQRLKVGGETL
jgi:hypothetical protein